MVEHLYYRELPNIKQTNKKNQTLKNMVNLHLLTPILLTMVYRPAYAHPDKLHGYLLPPAKIKYQVTLSTKIQIDEKKSPSVFISARI